MPCCASRSAGVVVLENVTGFADLDGLTNDWAVAMKLMVCCPVGPAGGAHRCGQEVASVLKHGHVTFYKMDTGIKFNAALVLRGLASERRRRRACRGLEPPQTVHTSWAVDRSRPTIYDKFYAMSDRRRTQDARRRRPGQSSCWRLVPLYGLPSRNQGLWFTATSASYVGSTRVGWVAVTASSTA